MAVMTNTKSPLLSERRALLGTMVSKAALCCPTASVRLVPASTSPVTRKTRSLPWPGLEGSLAIASKVAFTSPPQ